MTRPGGGERRVCGPAAATVSAEWKGLQGRFLWPDQDLYELICPVVLFDQPRKGRARETDVSARTFSRAVDRFLQRSLPGLAQATGVRLGDRRLVPAAVCNHILSLKAQHSPSPSTRSRRSATYASAAWSIRAPSAVCSVASRPSPLHRDASRALLRS